MALVSAHVGILATCSKCGGGTPVNGIVESIPCQNCLNAISIHQGAWIGLLDDFVEEAPRRAEGEVENTKVLAPFGEFSVDHGRARPACPACGHSVSQEELEGITGPFPCPACGESISVRRPPDWFNAIHPDARFLVGESLGGLRAEVEKGKEPITVHCTSCGGHLAVSGATRTVACDYCSFENFLPDPIWQRLHPASTRTPWFIVVNTGEAGAALPIDLEDFCDLAYAPDGSLIIAYVEEYIDYEDEDDDDEEEDDDEDDDDEEIRSRVAKLDSRGLITWIRNDIEFRRDARLLCSPNGDRLLLVVPNRGMLYHLDPADGHTLRKIACPDNHTRAEKANLPLEEPRSLSLYSARGFALHPNGELVILRFGTADSKPVFTRYSEAGEQIPMWPAVEEPIEEPAPEPKHGFFKRLFGRTPEKEEPQPVRYFDYPGWNKLADRILIPPEDVKFAFSPRGELCLVSPDARHLARYDRAGNLLEARALPEPPAGQFSDISIDQTGALYQVYMPEQYWTDASGTHIRRIQVGGEPEVFLGARVEGSCYLGNSPPRLKVHPDGRLFLGHDLDGLRVVSPQGALLFRTAATIRMDEVHLRTFRNSRQAKQEH